MNEKIKSRQQHILKMLLEHKAGLSIDELAAALDISRNAVQQHLTVLERDGYIQVGVLSKTAGRPVRSFVLTESGVNYFPKQYAWFSELLLADLKKQMGAEGLQRYLEQLSANLAQGFLPQFSGKPMEERVVELLKIMDALGFKARSGEDATQAPFIEACHCIYHDLAQKHQEVCAFDRTLIATLLETNIEQEECMAMGGTVCRFKI